MSPLFENLKQSVCKWRGDGYACDSYPLIGEMLAHQTERQLGSPALQFLREPQFLALEVYWYVRLILKTPHIIDLYKHYYGEDDLEELLKALGVPMSEDALRFARLDEVTKSIREDESFVRKKGIQALHEAINLDYPSYVLALAMGAGKTVLIGTIIATEFAMSLRYPDPGDQIKFMKNALVFAPGTTIIESLRELSDIPYEKILPPDLNRDFLANLKIEFPGSDKDIQVQKDSTYNMIVTNTEKISLRAQRRKNQDELKFREKELQANLRLQTIASLPDLGIFSDEAHHTYGNTFDKLKRVRETINYIHSERPIVAVVNTTGTPYYKRQLLKEVIVWYGLGDGIKDNILKDLNNGIHRYDIGEQPEEVFEDIVREFFKTYGNVSLPDGARAKIAFYFRTQEHLESSKPLIEKAMVEVGQDISRILVNTQQSSESEIDEFKRLNNPDSQKQVILLISKGVEGWNCPSLFACALIKKQTKSNNYVLQASTRCLRQISGNHHSAKVFLDRDNANILDEELQDNFGTGLGELSERERERETVTLRILKTELPNLEITRTVKKVVRRDKPDANVRLEKPKSQKVPGTLLSILTPDFSGPREILMPTGETRALPAGKSAADHRTTAWKIASRYHLPIVPILKKLRQLYPKGSIPNSHLYGLFHQIEKQQANYETVEEEVKEIMALIRVQDEDGEDVFEKDEQGVYVHRLRLLKRTYDRMRESGLFADKGDYRDKHDFSFHYAPYNFDSEPERSTFQDVLSMLNTDPNDVKTFLFTGGLTDPKKTDFHFEYLGEDKRYHLYFPDFVVVKKTGEFYIIEVKSQHKQDDKTVEAKKKAVERLRAMQPDKFRYQVIYVSANVVEVEETRPLKDWLESREC